MEEKKIEPAQTKPESKPNLLFAILAAIGLALVGCVLYGILYYVGYIAWIASYIVVLLSAWGYKHFNKKMDWKGYLTVAIASVALLLVTMFISLTLYLSKKFGLSFGETANTVFSQIETNKEVRTAVVKDGVLTAVFTLLGLLSYFFYEMRARKLNLKEAETTNSAKEKNKVQTANIETIEDDKQVALENNQEKEKKLTAVPEVAKVTKPTTRKTTHKQTQVNKPLVVKPVVSNKTKTTNSKTNNSQTKKTTSTNKKGE